MRTAEITSDPINPIPLEKKKNTSFPWFECQFRRTAVVPQGRRERPRVTVLFVEITVLPALSARAYIARMTHDAFKELISALGHLRLRSCGCSLGRAKQTNVPLGGR